MIYAYIAVHMNDSASVKKAIQAYTCSHNAVVDQFIEDPLSNKMHWDARALAPLIRTTAQKGDTIYVYEASNIARSTSQVLDVFRTLLERGVDMHLIKYDQTFSSEKMGATPELITLIRHIESDFVTKRTTEALARRREAGLPLGRPKGHLNKSLKLDSHRREIQKYLDLGISKASIAKLINCHAQTLYNYVEKRGLEAQRDTVGAKKNQTA
jgi:DNA invertase Pin-like site-specific DNA recombinase